MVSRRRLDERACADFGVNDVAASSTLDWTAIDCIDLDVGAHHGAWRLCGDESPASYFWFWPIPAIRLVISRVGKATVGHFLTLNEGVLDFV